MTYFYVVLKRVIHASASLFEGMGMDKMVRGGTEGGRAWAFARWAG